MTSTITTLTIELIEQTTTPQEKVMALITSLNKLSDAKAVIVAVARQNESDTMTDYFAYKSTKTVVLAFSTTDRNMFAEMRKAALFFEPTQCYGPGKGSFRIVDCFQTEEGYDRSLRFDRDPVSQEYLAFSTEEEAQAKIDEIMELKASQEGMSWDDPNRVYIGIHGNLEVIGDIDNIEHRENYSMGAGYYLGESKYSGWIIEKRPYSPGNAYEEGINTLIEKGEYCFGKGKYAAKKIKDYTGSKKTKISNKEVEGNGVRFVINGDRNTVELYWPNNQVPMMDIPKMGVHNFKSSARGFYYAPVSDSCLDYVYGLTGVERDSSEVVETKAESVDGVRYELNDEKGGVEIYFPGKPSDEIRDNLKANKFRWSRHSKCWYARQDESTIALAKAIAGDDSAVDKVDVGVTEDAPEKPTALLALPAAEEKPSERHLSVVPDVTPSFVVVTEVEDKAVMIESNQEPNYVVVDSSPEIEPAKLWLKLPEINPENIIVNLGELQLVKFPGWNDYVVLFHMDGESEILDRGTDLRDMVEKTMDLYSGGSAIATA